MKLMNFFQTAGLIAACVLPFWNIPLIMKILKRKSSADMSLAWVLGVEACILVMFPSTMVSADPILRVYGVLNTLFFTAVTIVVWIYRSRS